MSASFRAHLEGHLQAFAEVALWEPTIERWADRLCRTFGAGGRLCVAGNGGSAAEAQHLTGELVGRFLTERRPLPAIALHAETSTLTAIANDYGWEEAYARTLLGLAGKGDVLLALSTSGRSPNLLHAARAARSAGISVWALTGPRSSPLGDLADEVIAAPGPPPVVQELHLTAIHLLCATIDEHLEEGAASSDHPLAGVPAGLDKEESAWT